jgi:hypothetical protein
MRVFNEEMYLHLIGISKTKMASISKIKMAGISKLK